jgi:signal transduction histidine kinase
MELITQPTDVAALVEDAVASFTIYAHEKGVKVTYKRKPDEIPILMTDAIRLRQVRTLVAVCRVIACKPLSANGCRTPSRCHCENGCFPIPWQVLFNLLGNAVKFTTRGGIEVNLTYADETLELSVTDTGPGMTAEQLSRLFQPYTQVCT